MPLTDMVSSNSGTAAVCSAGVVVVVNVFLYLGAATVFL